MLSISHILFAAAALSAPGLESGTQFTFRGQMLGVKGEASETRKAFDVSLLVSSADAAGTTFHWTLDERGRGGFAWPDRVGRWRFDSKGKTEGDTGPALLYDRGDGLSVVPLHALLYPDDKPHSNGGTATEGKLEYLVAGEEKSSGKDCWRVEVRNQYGPKRVLWVEKTRPLIAALSETVFIGQGQQFDLRLELVDEKKLDASQVEKSVAAMDGLLALRDKLGRLPRTERGQWSEAQTAALKAAFPADFKSPAEGPIAAVYKAALADAGDQKDRSSAVGALREKIVGTKIDELPLEDLAGKPASAEDLKGSVTVLHFWEYKDSPLEEPYGQTGFLDYLSRQKKAKGLKVYGVAVDARLADPDKRRQAIAGVKKFQSFMNLSYPLLLDSGPALKKFGDPRPAGAKLPVFVLLDSAGKVLLYQVGHFEVKRDRGLEELEAAVEKALAK